MRNKNINAWVALNRFGVVVGHRIKDYCVIDAFKQLFGQSWYDSMMSPEKRLGRSERQIYDDMQRRIEATGWKIVEVKMELCNESAGAEVDLDFDEEDCGPDGGSGHPETWRD